MTSKPRFWVAIALASALSFYFSWHFFAKAFPLLNIDITMSRDAALRTATARAAALALVPPDARSAVRFTKDDDAQNFTELEAGGADAFIGLMSNDIYQAFKWEIRFFREKDAHVTTLYFTPQGRPYGFERRVPESDAGAALDAGAAQTIAEAAALRDWQIDLSAGKSPYALAEKSFEKRPSGRIDHAFVYERGDQRLGKNGEGRIRLRLTVSGDQLTQLRHFVRVPESFQRRYAEMRSTNTIIATTASLAMGLLYLLGGCVFGLILLNRQRFIVSRPPLRWAALVALLQTAMLLNQIPSTWFNYDTAVSANVFIGQQILLAAGAFFGTWLLLGVSFMAAESLTRKAFGRHPQLWKLWSPGVAGSRAVFGRTVAGYLWVGFDLAFIVLFYYLTQHYLGWWSPLETLVDPNILATPMPWLGPVAQSLQAGFWEECLFRAVPLAGAALIGDYLNTRFSGRFGGRTAWLAIGLVVQAIIFSAAHASYAQQPAYARMVELFIPSIIWGLVYLRFGLLPGILFHFVFDLLLMSLPIFATSAPGLGVDRAIVITCGLVPLGVVVWTRLRERAWQEFPEALTNAAWQPPAALEHISTLRSDHSQEQAVWQRMRRVLPVLGVIGFAAWLALSPFSQDLPPLFLERAQAETAAATALRERGVAQGAQWQRFAQIAEATEPMPEAFVWREGGKGAYDGLMGSYIAPPLWRVRYVRFEGDVAERAEEWHVYVENGVDGKAGREVAPHVRRIEHILPDAQAGKSLAVDEARVIAQRALRERFGREPTGVREVSAVESRRPNRSDWRFEFADDRSYPLKIGEARLWITVSGDEVTSTGRFVHVPEDWARAERDRRANMRIAQIAVGIVIALLAVFAVIIAIIRSTRGDWDRRLFFVLSAGLFATLLVSVANNWQRVAIGFKTAEPLMNQVWIMAAAGAFGLLLASLTLALFATVGAKAVRSGKLGNARFVEALAPGAGLAALFVGLIAAANMISLHGLPYRVSPALLNMVSPALSVAISGFTGTVTDLALMSFALVVMQDFNAGFTKRRALTVLFLLFSGFAISLQAQDLSAFLIKGLATGAILVLLYVFIARFEPRVVLVALIAKLIFTQIATAAVQPYPNAWFYAVLYVSTLCLAAFWWMRVLDRKPDAGPPRTEAPVPAD